MVCRNDDDDDDAKRWFRCGSRRRHKYKGLLLSDAAALLLMLLLVPTVGSFHDDDSITFTTGESYSWVQWVQVPSDDDDDDDNNRLDEPTTTTVAAATGSIDLGDLEFRIRDARDFSSSSSSRIKKDDDDDNQTKEIYVRVGASLRRIVSRQERGSFWYSAGLACCDKPTFAEKKCPVRGDVYVRTFEDNVVVEDLGLMQVSLDSHRPDAVARLPKPFSPISYSGYFQVDITICAVDSLPQGSHHDSNTQVTLQHQPDFGNALSPALVVLVSVWLCTG
jgi:hypothetical protein